jgi:MarR family transcriptional regulator, organic hydroperoxide resistance regulator
MNEPPLAPLPSQFEQPEESPGFSLWQVASLWQRQINACLHPLGLTHAQFVLLTTLAWHVRAEKIITQAELAALAKTDVMMTSSVLRTLEKKGLITRRPHPSDTRALSLAVTAAGSALAAQAIQVVEAADRAFFGKLGEELPGFNAQLQALIQGG